MILGFRLEDVDDEAGKFLMDFNRRLSGTSNLYNKPWSPSRLKFVNGVWVLELEPMYPRLYWLGVLYCVIGFLLGWSFGAWLPGLFMLCLVVFWTPRFYLLMVRLGLRKVKSKARVVRIGEHDLLRLVVWGKMMY
jgi:hypothetical protein